MCLLSNKINELKNIILIFLTYVLLIFLLFIIKLKFWLF
jgi:hypothetical protein